MSDSLDDFNWLVPTPASMPSANPVLGKKCVIAVLGDDDELLWTAEVTLDDAEVTLHSSAAMKVTVEGTALGDNAIMFYEGYTKWVRGSL